MQEQWIEILPFQLDLKHFGCVYLRKRLYFIGGIKNHSSLSTVKVFNIDKGNFYKKPSMSLPRNRIGVCTIRSSIYAVGGMCGNKSYSVVERLDLQKDTNSQGDLNSNKCMKWSTVASMQKCTGQVAVAVFKNHIYAVGGNVGLEALKTCEFYKPSKNKWFSIASMNDGRFGAGAAVVDGFIYVVGGFKTNKIPVNSVEKYDPITDKWTYVTPMKTSRGGLKVASLGRYIYAIGGIGNMTEQNAVELYDVDENRWKDGPPVLSSFGAEVVKCPLNLNQILRLKKILDHNENAFSLKV